MDFFNGAVLSFLTTPGHYVSSMKGQVQREDFSLFSIFLPKQKDRGLEQHEDGYMMKAFLFLSDYFFKCYIKTSGGCLRNDCRVQPIAACMCVCV